MQNTTFILGDYLFWAAKLTKILIVINLDIVVTVSDLIHSLNFQADNRKNIYLSYCLKSNELIRWYYRITINILLVSLNQEWIFVRVNSFFYGNGVKTQQFIAKNSELKSYPYSYPFKRYVSQSHGKIAWLNRKVYNFSVI